jgi:pilus assembly protein CpaD
LSRYALQVEPNVERIALAVHETGLSPNQRAALHDLAGRYAHSGAPVIRVEAPAGNDPVADRHAYAVRDALQAAGVPAERITLSGYSAPDPRAPVLAGFETARAVVRDCAAEPHTVSSWGSNRGSLGFGCAVTSNMAAQIATPRDILTPRTMAPTDSGRSAVVFDNYRKGQASSAEQEPLVAGRVAEAVE